MMFNLSNIRANNAQKPIRPWGYISDVGEVIRHLILHKVFNFGVLISKTSLCPHPFASGP